MIRWFICLCLFGLTGCQPPSPRTSLSQATPTPSTNIEVQKLQHGPEQTLDIKTIEIKPIHLQLELYQTKKVQVIAQLSNGQQAEMINQSKITWTPSKPNIVSVVNGSIKAEALGEVVLTANVNGQQSWVTVSVVPASTPQEPSSTPTSSSTPTNQPTPGAPSNPPSVTDTGSTPSAVSPTPTPSSFLPNTPASPNTPSVAPTPTPTPTFQPITQPTASPVQQAYWSMLNVPINTSNEVIRDIQFHDSQTGWVMTNWGKLLYTSNGGGSWETRLNKDQEFYAVSFPTPQTGYLLAHNAIYTSTNGGLSWDLIDTNFPFNNSYTNSMVFKDPNTGLIVNYDGYFLTTDGGKTWAEIDDVYDPMGATIVYSSSKALILPRRGSMAGILDLNTRQFVRLSSLSPDFSGLISYIGAGFIGEQGYIFGNDLFYLSPDGGTTWNKVPKLKTETQFLTHFSISAMYFSSAQQGMIILSNKEQYRTENGGESWSKAGQDLPIHSSSTAYRDLVLFNGEGWLLDKGTSKLMKLAKLN